MGLKDVRLEIRVSGNISPEKLLEINSNIKYIKRLPPFKVDYRLKGKIINYEKGYREIRVLKGLKSFEEMKEMETTNGLRPIGIYDKSPFNADFLQYWVTDWANVADTEYNNGLLPVAVKLYNERKLNRLRISRIKPSN
ncbi:hypothetical protein J4407_00715 [Candidatus Pacearchaeota archaeon]|nr:hypothetical protein [Candidatus Pacearchaeota archaeon]